MSEMVSPCPTAGQPGPAVTLCYRLGSKQSGFLQKWDRYHCTARTSTSPRAVKDVEPQPSPSLLAGADSAATLEDGLVASCETQRSVTLREMPLETTRLTRHRVTRDS